MIIRPHSVEIETDYFVSNPEALVAISDALFDANLDDATIYTKNNGRVCFGVTRDASTVGEVIDSVKLDLDKVKGINIEMVSWNIDDDF